MKRPGVRIIATFTFVIAFILIAAFVLIPGRPPDQPLPIPNGYDDFVKAAGMLAGSFSDYRNMNEVDLRAILAKNSEALKLARTGLDKECQVPLNPSIHPRHPDLRNLALAFGAAGRFAD